MECPICYEPYDLQARRPKSLPCGHSVCLQCLTHSAFRYQCPLDRTDIGYPSHLPDTRALITLLDEARAASSHQLWCRDCDDPFSEACGAAGHSRCSRRGLRAERAAPLLSALREGAEAAWKLRWHVDLADRDWRDRIDGWKEAAGRAEDALRRLCAAVDAGGDAVDEAAAERAARDVASLRDSAHLSEALGRCSLVLQEEDGARWEGSLALQHEVHQVPLRQLLMQMQRDGVLRKTQEPSGVSAFPTSVSVENLLVKELDELLDGDELRPIRVLKGINCISLGSLALQALERFAASVEELEFSIPSQEHLDALEKMPRLRKLSILNIFPAEGEILDFPPCFSKLEELSLESARMRHMRTLSTLSNLRVLKVDWYPDCTDDDDRDDTQPYPDLPLGLEELELRPAVRQQVLSIQRMPQLRRLATSFHDPGDVADLVSLPPPAHHCGLQSLALPLCDGLGLVKAHAATLRELRIGCDTVPATCSIYETLRQPPTQPVDVEGLPEALRGCALGALEELVLVRPKLDDPWRAEDHVEPCRAQLGRVREALRGTFGLSVSCSMCRD